MGFSKVPVFLCHSVFSEYPAQSVETEFQKFILYLCWGAGEVVGLTEVRPRLVTDSEIRAFIVKALVRGLVPGSSVGTATGYRLDVPGIESRWAEIFRTCPDRPWGPPNLLYKGYRVFSGGKEQPGRDADPSPPSSVVVMKG